MCTYLSKRGSTYYFRRVIPDELRPAFDGAREFMFSLRVKDREAAKRKLPHETLRTDQLLDRARARLTDTAGSTPPVRTSAPALSAWETAQVESAREDDAEREARREELAEYVEFLRDRLRGSTREMPRELRAFRYLLEGHEFDNKLLQDQLTKARAEKRELEQRMGRMEPQAVSSAPVNGRQIPSSPPPTVPLLDTFEAYAAAQGLKAGTAKEWRARMGGLIAFLGHDDAAKISADDVQRWRDQLLSETVRGGKKRDPRTVRSTYLSALRATLNWAVEERKLPSNVAAAIVVRVPRKAKLRERDFTTEEATRILKATLVQDARLSEERAFARRWIPWLCAYTGARVNEFSQLRREDVQQIDGVWAVNITPEAGTVKTNVARTVPLHSHLLEQGFVEAVSSRKDGPLFYDPSKQRVQADASRHYKKVGERLAAWVRRDVGIADPNVQPNHGWRHTFKTRALSAGMPERIADYIQGHAPRTVGRTYGSVLMSTLVEAIESLPRFHVESEAATAQAQLLQLSLS